MDGAAVMVYPSTLAVITVIVDEDNRTIIVAPVASPCDGARSVGCQVVTWYRT